MANGSLVSPTASALQKSMRRISRSFDDDPITISHRERQQGLQVNFKVKIDKKTGAQRAPPVKLDPQQLQDEIILDSPHHTHSSSSSGGSGGGGGNNSSTGNNNNSSSSSNVNGAMTSNGTNISMSSNAASISSVVMAATSSNIPFPHLQGSITTATGTPAVAVASSNTATPASATALESLDDVNVTDLKEMLRKRGLPTTGRKATLVERLRSPQRITPLQLVDSTSSSPAVSPKITPRSPRYSPYGNMSPLPDGHSVSPRLFDSSLSLQSPHMTVRGNLLESKNFFPNFF
jgi:hypothetical protein